MANGSSDVHTQHKQTNSQARDEADQKQRRMLPLPLGARPLDSSVPADKLYTKSISSILFPSEPPISAAELLKRTAKRTGRDVVEGVGNLDIALDIEDEGTRQDPDAVALATHKTHKEGGSVLSDVSEVVASLQTVMRLAQAIGPGSQEYRKAQEIRRWIGQQALRWTSNNHQLRPEIGFLARPNAGSITPPDDPEAAARRIAETWAMLDRLLSEYEEVKEESESENDDNDGNDADDEDEDDD